MVSDDKETRHWLGPLRTRCVSGVVRKVIEHGWENGAYAAELSREVDNVDGERISCREL